MLKVKTDQKKETKRLNHTLNGQWFDMRSCLFECHVLSTLCFHTIDLWSIELERINERNRKKNIHSKNCILNCSFGQRRKSAICRFLSFYKFIIVYLAVLYASAFTYIFKIDKMPSEKKYIALDLFFVFI